jgi:hypothetical protein
MLEICVLFLNISLSEANAFSRNVFDGSSAVVPGRGGKPKLEQKDKDIQDKDKEIKDLKDAPGSDTHDDVTPEVDNVDAGDIYKALKQIN